MGRNKKAREAERRYQNIRSLCELAALQANKHNQIRARQLIEAAENDLGEFRKYVLRQQEQGANPQSLDILHSHLQAAESAFLSFTVAYSERINYNRQNG